jgi:O-antigen/teichoic acid export membrane protein
MIGIIQGRERFFQFNLILVLISVTQIVSLGLLVVGLKGGLIAAIGCYFFSNLVGVCAALYYIHKMTPISFSFNLAGFRESLKYGGKTYLSDLAQYLNYRMDQFLVGYFLGPTALGFYAVAASISEQLWLIPQAIAKVLLPRIAALDSDQANLLTPIIARSTLLITGVIAIGLALLARPFIKLLFGISFAPTVPALLWLLPGTVALGYGKVLVSDLLGRGKPMIALVSSGVSLMFTVLLDILLIPRINISGAAIASSVSYIIATMIVVIAFLKASSVPWNRMFFSLKEDVQTYVAFFEEVRKQLRI